ncbi:MULTISPECIES: phosphatase PAP2/dual specificity phosphatase family protein [unclassified Bradyrhizobium]|uniref:phosphatase PAP2/dual specificity phosphatase family protein n=1 Tax=unclassified Bradyrhizobium TaxID=2631580 RepID=UPI0020125E33|nr:MULTISPECIES: phosphatase PAP2/dual specificity phosphatase family protein [unclassified Bradyrhizobium]
MTVTESSPTTTTRESVPERPWRRAFAWLCFLTPFFYLTYGAANWLALLRPGVPSIVFGWEHAIPFLGWTIIPYWSINAFYGLSLFVCASRDELDTHGRRLLTAQVVAVICFILLPLRFTFTQPETVGLPGFLFAALTSFDKPFNQAPSLHIALLVILWVLYARHLPRWALYLLHPWFALVGASVLTTYQHHFIDVPTGALLGLFCLWLWPDRGPTPISVFALTRDPQRRRLAIHYAAGALVFAGAALLTGGAGWWLFWPALALAFVAANYAVFGAAGFQKGADGRMSLAVRLLLAPYLAGAWINSRIWTRNEPTQAAVDDGVAIGRMPSRGDSRTFASIVDLSAEMPALRAHDGWHAYPALDLVAPPPSTLREAAAMIERTRASGAVLVCCALGYSRSASAVAVWLLVTGRASSIQDAVERVRRVRPRIVLGADALQAIEHAARGNTP